MKILSAHKFYWDRDGASRYQLELNRLLEARGHSTIPFAMQSPQNLPSPWSRFFVPSVQTQAKTTAALNGLRTAERMLMGGASCTAIRGLIAEAQPDIAHIHNIYTQISPSILNELKRERIPCVQTVHDYHLIAPNYMLWHKGRVENMGTRSLISATMSRYHQGSIAASALQSFTFAIDQKFGRYKNRIDRFICPSAFLKQRMQMAGFSESQLVHIPHFFDLKALEVFQQERRAQLGVNQESESDGSILFVGRFYEEKGVRFVLELAKHMPSQTFVLVGDGPLMNEVKQAVKNQPDIEAPGWGDRAMLDYYYTRASMVLVPSLWHEVFGLVAVEAMARKKPVLVSDMGGLPEVVEDGVSGRVLPMEFQAWKQAIVELIEHPERAEEMGKRGYERVQNVFTPERHVDALLTEFTSLLEG